MDLNQLSLKAKLLRRLLGLKMRTDLLYGEVSLEDPTIRHGKGTYSTNVQI
jgi:hypothetical protein